MEILKKTTSFYHFDKMERVYCTAEREESADVVRQHFPVATWGIAADQIPPWARKHLSPF